MEQDDKKWLLKVADTTERGVQCLLGTDTGAFPPFWLSKQHCEWERNPDHPGDTPFLYVSVPMWLAQKHQQLVGKDRFKISKQEKKEQRAMSYELKEGQFVVFKNDKRESDKHPHWKGRGLQNGKEMELALWEREDRNGNRYFSGKLSDPNNWKTAQAPASEPTRAVTATQSFDKVLDDEIPF